MHTDKLKGAICFRGTDSAEIVPLIKTISRFGDGSDGNPVRTITQYWTLDGSLLFNDDPYLRDIKSDSAVTHSMHIQ